MFTMIVNNGSVPLPQAEKREPAPRAVLSRRAEYAKKCRRLRVEGEEISMILFPPLRVLFHLLQERCYDIRSRIDEYTLPNITKSYKKYSKVTIQEGHEKAGRTGYPKKVCSSAENSSIPCFRKVER